VASLIFNIVQHQHLMAPEKAFGLASWCCRFCGLAVFVLEAVQQLPEQNYMIVANLYNSEQVMPHFIVWF
jgi:hypothetical protein